MEEKVTEVFFLAYLGFIFHSCDSFACLKNYSLPLRLSNPSSCSLCGSKTKLIDKLVYTSHMGVVSLQHAPESIIIEETTMHCNLVVKKSGGLRFIMEIKVRGKARLANIFYVAFTNALNTLNEARKCNASQTLRWHFPAGD
jgi:hypothetical protein